jgi:hypothetical protein
MLTRDLLPDDLHVGHVQRKKARHDFCT